MPPHQPSKRRPAQNAQGQHQIQHSDLGVKFPFASWGNIMNDVSNAYVLTSYPFVWLPAGICLVVSVLGFNFVGDGLRDAFDPKMKR